MFAVECCLLMSVVVCVGCGSLGVGGVCGVMEVFVVVGGVDCSLYIIVSACCC